MKTRIIEGTNQTNYGKFMLGWFDAEEWAHTSHLSDVSDEYVPNMERISVIAARGWTQRHLWVMDLQTGEGAMFFPGGSAHADLEKHAIWVCPMFEPFLVWLYQQDLSDPSKLPHAVRLEGESALYGYRRPGPKMTTLKFTAE